MAINEPRIAGKPAIERRRIKDQPLSVRNAPPTESYLDTDSDGLPINNEALVPETEGQLVAAFSVDDTGLNRSMQLYVAIDIGGTLTWKAVSNTTLLNKWTGKPYDPIFDSYS